ncbi:outer membrane protein assembly factor BamE [Paraburkholderia flava]|uniref:outer membrane protein assembly factor BamE n=1 Tax=Paraburkholderia flava TaxID=2547393 RepID=UPI0010622620|nr:outer membrane protein assembly factor BamE [Paraburkholderia flava]
MRGTLLSTVAAVAVITVLGGCSTYDSLTQRIAQTITPYRITVVQGNFVSKEAAAQMQVGMSRAQVKQILGTPLLTDMFHADRWDYVFYFKRGSTSIVQQRDFVVNFAGDRVASWSGGEDLPSNLELLAEIDGDRTGKKVKVPAAASGASVAAAASSASAAPAADASSAPDQSSAGTDANEQAAQAANRATNAALQSGGAPQVRSAVPSSNGGVPQAATQPGQPQFQFHRPAPPQVQGPQDNPVGPTGGSQSSGPTYNAPLTAPPSAAPPSTGTGE